MTVKELIDKLSKMPEDHPVYVGIDEEVYNAVKNYNALKVIGIKDVGCIIEIECQEE